MTAFYAILLMFFMHLMQPDAVMPSDIDTFLQNGLNLEQQEVPEQALLLWQQAIDELAIPSVAIATEYLRVATQYGLRDYYPSAHEAYRWGMSGYNPAAMQVNRKPLEEEISRMEPLLEESVYRHWTRLLGQARQFPELLVDPDAEIPSRSVMLIPWNEQSDTQIFYVELVNIHPGSQPRMESLFPESLRGLGKVEIAQPQPLLLREGELGVGDIILGYRKVDEAPDDQVLFHFTPANNRKIPAGENLVVHFEVYQLQTDPDGFSSFDLDYEIRPRSRLFGWTRSQADQFSISLTFENEGERFAESLEIETIQLDPGSYELSLTIRETASNLTHEQKVQFEVVE